MNPVVRAQLKAFSKTHSSLKFNEAEFFEVYAIHSISNGLKTDDIDPFHAHLEGNEFGLDGLSMLIQGELCTNSDGVSEALAVGKSHTVEFDLFQAKTSENADYGAMSKFFDSVVSFFNGEFIDASDQLEDRIAAKDAIYAAALKRNPKLNLFYVTTGKGMISNQIQQLIDKTICQLNDMNIFDEVEFNLVGAKELQDGYRSATNSNTETVEILKPITLPDHPSVQQAFLGYVEATQLVKLVTIRTDANSPPRINHSVFFDNVRDFNDKSDINQGILQELKSKESKSFIFKNNGVTIVSKGVSRKGDKFELEDYQIVNGCQTSNILFLAGKDAENVHVPFRLIVSDDADFISTVIVGTNRQNEVKEDQFWALTPFMKDLEEYCKEQIDDERIFIERRENQYRNEAVERTRICKPSELIKSIAAIYMYQPHRAARDYRGIRKEFGAQLFQSDHNVEIYHAAALASYKLDFAIRNKRVPHSWGIYKFYVLYTIGKQSAGMTNALNCPPKNQKRIAAEIIELATNEDELVKQFSDCADVLDNIIKDAGLDGREKIRDYIRSESVTHEFSQKLGLEKKD